MTNDGIRQLLRTLCERKGGQRTVAQEFGVSVAFLSAVITGRKQPPGWLMEKVGYRKVITIRRLSPAETE